MDQLTIDNFLKDLDALLAKHNVSIMGNCNDDEQQQLYVFFKDDNGVDLELEGGHIWAGNVKQAKEN